jgi:DNA-binding MarR family transcriptional regulator
MMVISMLEEAMILISYNSEETRLSIFADTKSSMRNLQSIVESMRLHVLYAGPTANAESRLDGFPVGDAILLNIDENCDATLDLFLDRLDRMAASDGLPVLVNAAPENLDAVAARLGAPSVTLMCRATAADWVTSLAMMDMRGPTALNDVALDESMRFQRLAEEVQRIARTLSDLAGPTAVPFAGMSDAAIGFRAGATPYTPPPVASVSAADVRAIIRLRRMRDRYFKSDLFADPSWDMLLDLMAARIERKRVPVSSLCIAAAVPPTTGLRWIKTMCDHGLFVRVADPEDGRRVFIELSDGAATAMTAYLSAAKATGGLAV